MAYESLARIAHCRLEEVVELKGRILETLFKVVADPLG